MGEAVAASLIPGTIETPVGTVGSAVMVQPLPRTIALAGSVPVLKTIFEPSRTTLALPVGMLMLFVPQKTCPPPGLVTTALAGAVPVTGLVGTAPITILTAPPVAPVVPMLALEPMTIEPLLVLSCSKVILPLLAVIDAPEFTRMSEFGPGEVMFFKASRLTKPVPPPLPALIGPATVMLPTVAPVNDCVNTVIFVLAVNVPSVMLPESATKIGPAVAVTLDRVRGPGPAKLKV